MRKITLITGGVRSGKSAYALALGQDLPKPAVFIATAPALDEEMKRRIARHRRQRQDLGWQTIEAQTDLKGAIEARADAPTVLVDCLGIWINNLLYHKGMDVVGEDFMARTCQDVIEVCRNQSGNLILVTNETGLGIMPENALARRFGDVLGRCNQTFAAHAARVVMMVSGLPLELKNPGKPS